ncbi:hypothetical protein GCM10010116_15370 [Microbispora rosea subsp. aerata]|nr:hypothetical protein [Microbispora rosea]GGO07625.1 hypothetical protein GCM10010116_15370 [Microbispora rosea subsp. aerata]GIH53236.1 hypothetical protein Mro02_01500 [Microbispora rosea subsp. aerata]GLJ83852.1 hypothetical protein GCM10017588_25800 [Microbispora rosea subsp. aerata]
MSDPQPSADPLLRVRDLRIEVPGGAEAVGGVSFDVAPGEAAGLVLTGAGVAALGPSARP